MFQNWLQQLSIACFSHVCYRPHQIDKHGFVCVATHGFSFIQKNTKFRYDFLLVTFGCTNHGQCAACDYWIGCSPDNIQKHVVYRLSLPNQFHVVCNFIVVLGIHTLGNNSQTSAADISPSASANGDTANIAPNTTRANGDDFLCSMDM